MIVAGIGCRKGASAEQVMAALRAALEMHDVQHADLGLLATAEIKRNEEGIALAAHASNVPLMVLDEGRLKAAAAHCSTKSVKSMEISGVPSLSEAAALAGAGAGGRLLGPRTVIDNVTCALAITAPVEPAARVVNAVEDRNG